jgi:hypothetical protein
MYYLVFFAKSNFLNSEPGREKRKQESVGFCLLLAEKYGFSLIA